MILIDQNVILYNKMTKKHNYSKIYQAVQNSIKLNDFGNLFDIQEYKFSENTYYIVINSTHGYEIVFFDSQQKAVNMINVNFSNYSNYDLISAIKIGDTLDYVLSADDTGCFGFLNVSWTNYTRISFHFFENGVCFSFEYDKDYRVANIWRYTF